MTEPEARALADALLQVSATQPAAEANKLLELALARAPHHPAVLNAAAGHLQRIGDHRRACELFRRATTLDPTSKVLWLNLATGCRLLGDPMAESLALEKALALEPRYVPALLQKADLMERVGRPLGAVQMFEAALASIAPGEIIPPHLTGAVTHAREVVARNLDKLAAFLDTALAPLRTSHDGGALERGEAYRELLLGRRRAYASLPRDSYFPYLPAIEFFPRELFPWLSVLEAASADIAAEAEAALRTAGTAFKPYVEFPAGTPLDEWAPLNGSMDWSVYTLWHDGAPVPEHQAACPKTTAVLAQLPMCDVPGYAPGAYFSVLKPRTRLPPHTGTTNTRAIAHLPLVIPSGCRFRVGAQTRAWEQGKAWVFDDTIEHDAVNDSDQARIILIFDVWNPLLSPAERDLVRAVTVARGQYYGTESPIMGSR